MADWKPYISATSRRAFPTPPMTKTCSLRYLSTIPLIGVWDWMNRSSESGTLSCWDNFSIRFESWAPAEFARKMKGTPMFVRCWRVSEAPGSGVSERSRIPSMSKANPTSDLALVLLLSLAAICSKENPGRSSLNVIKSSRYGDIFAVCFFWKAVDLPEVESFEKTL